MFTRIVIAGLLVCAVVFGYPYLAGMLAGAKDLARTDTPGHRQAGLVVRDVRVYDLDGRLAYRGEIDLRPEIARIERGESHPHANDGAVFQNRERRLPSREPGYYREYVVRTPNMRHAGPQRLVMGAGGEIYYTADHYRTFRRIR